MKAKIHYRGERRTKDVKGIQPARATLASEGEDDDGVTVFARRNFCLREQSRFEIVSIDVEFTRFDLFRGRAVEAQFAHAEAALGAYRWPEYAAGHGTRCIQIASAGLPIENRTRFVIGIVLECPALLGEYSRGCVSRKAGAQTTDCSMGPLPHASRPQGIMLFQLGQTFL